MIVLTALRNRLTPRGLIIGGLVGGGAVYVGFDGDWYCAHGVLAKGQENG